LGQGLVDFRNGGVTFPTVADRKVYAGPNNPLTGVNFVAGLWYLPGADRGSEIFSVGNQAGRTFNFRPPTTTLPGTWVVGSASPLFVLNSVAIGDSATLQVRVWDGAKYASFNQAVAGGEYGMSAPFNYTVPPTGSTPDKYYMDNLRAFGAPEPSTWALAALGAFGLWWWRRKNAARG